MPDVKASADQLRPVPELDRVQDRLRYRTLDTVCAAQGESLMGYVWLCKTQAGRWLVVLETGGLVDALTGLRSRIVLSATPIENAKVIYEELRHQVLPYAEAFGVDVPDA